MCVQNKSKYCTNNIILSTRYTVCQHVFNWSVLLPRSYKNECTKYCWNSNGDLLRSKAVILILLCCTLTELRLSRIENKLWCNDFLLASYQKKCHIIMKISINTCWKTIVRWLKHRVPLTREMETLYLTFYTMCIF